METNRNGSQTTATTGTKGKMMVGMFPDRESAEHAYNDILERGYTSEEVNLVMSKDTRKKYFPDENGEGHIGNKALEGAGAGSAIGGVVGAVAGIIAAVGTSILIPGLGVIIAGPLAAGLAGAGAGGITGGLIGALVGYGVPENKAKIYEKGIKEGRIVLGVKPHTEEDAQFFESDWRKNKAEEIYR